MKVTVIIPIYNTFKSLTQCVNSVLSQTLKDIEIVLINDGSSNSKTDKICNKYYKSYNNIKYIKKESNEGVEMARLDGIYIAEGKYIFFLDSDDWIEPFTLKLLYENAEKTNADYVEIGARYVYDSYKIFKHDINQPIIGIIEQPELFENYFISFFGDASLRVTIWGRLYRRNIFNIIKLNAYGFIYGEDLMTQLMIFPSLKKIMILKEIGYNYRYGGMSSKYNPRIFYDLKRQHLIKKNLIKKYNYHKAYPVLNYHLKEVLKSMIFQMIIYGKKNRDEILDRLKKEREDEIYEDILNIESNDIFIESFKKYEFDKIIEIFNNKMRKERKNLILKKLIKYILRFT